MIVSCDPHRAMILFVEAGLGVFGMTVVLTPLALWVAWSEEIYYGTLVVCFIGVGLFIGFAQLLRLLQHGEIDEEAAATARVYAEKMREPGGVDWDAIELDDPAVKQNRREFSNQALQSVKLVFWSASIMLALGGGLLLAAYYLISTYIILP